MIKQKHLKKKKNFQDCTLRKKQSTTNTGSNYLIYNNIEKIACDNCRMRFNVGS